MENVHVKIIGDTLNFGNTCGIKLNFLFCVVISQLQIEISFSGFFSNVVRVIELREILSNVPKRWKE